jgi:hypothetical protein
LPARWKSAASWSRCCFTKTSGFWVAPDLTVRLRFYDDDDQMLFEVAATPARALRLSILFRLAAERADPSLLLQALAAPEPVE